jgi:hypothetical protein
MRTLAISRRWPQTAHADHGMAAERVPLIAGREVTGGGAARVRLAIGDVIHALDRLGTGGETASPPPIDRDGIRQQKLVPRLAASVSDRNR